MGIGGRHERDPAGLGLDWGKGTVVGIKGRLQGSGTKAQPEALPPRAGETQNLSACDNFLSPHSSAYYC